MLEVNNYFSYLEKESFGLPFFCKISSRLIWPSLADTHASTVYVSLE